MAHLDSAYLTPDSSLNILNIESLNDKSDKNFARLVKLAMKFPGYIILRGIDVDPNNIATSSARLLTLAENIGKPISHDEENSLVWHIKKNENLNQTVPTYSEHSNEAFLHTDSQYREDPEHIFALLMLKKADCGGGASMLMTYDDLMTELNTTPSRKRLSKVLADESYPFVVPTAFKRNLDEKREYVYSPILEKHEKLRFRSDTLKIALEDKNNMVSKQALEAYEMMLGLLSSSKLVRRFHLQPRDIIFINNRTCLHGRSIFKDSNRHLLRVRLNLEDSSGLSR